ncbi:TetR/AcrR family transcriptional regulator [uncultured Williamsia sp.]|uniref:TetR/AcrR family transcriptional regulator n=1 Tax=uncultured Williamsia sp. TaxID=259311 RepID=UPI0026309D1D|nr:TetR/AcrR family transcriptional regulator [uncultured Williamsia sp.]
MATDWLVGQTRASAAAQRIHRAAATLIARRGTDDFTINEIAAMVHCSPATVYRHAGGKDQIREAVLTQMSARIVGDVFAAIDGLSGADRIVTAMRIGIDRIRTEPITQRMMTTTTAPPHWVENSSVIAAVTAEMIGCAPEDVAVKWFIRSVLALCQWPVGDEDVEREILERFVGPVLTPSSSPSTGQPSNVGV